jgi:hypothetical protein
MTKEVLPPELKEEPESIWLGEHVGGLGEKDEGFDIGLKRRIVLLLFDTSI